MRVADEEVPVLEGAGLPLVGVHRHQPRPRLGPHGAPLAAGREARAAKASQAAIVERPQNLLDGERAGAQAVQKAVAASGSIGVVPDVGGYPRMRLVRRDRPGGPLGRRPMQEMVADFCDRRLVA